MREQVLAQEASQMDPRCLLSSRIDLRISRETRKFRFAVSNLSVGNLLKEKKEDKKL